MLAESALTAPPSAAEAAILARIDGKTMLTRVESWAAINSGSRNLSGLARMASELVPAFTALGAIVELRAPTRVEAIDPTGTARPLAHGDNLHATIRSDASVRVLLTGHMDTVFAADHPFQSCRWL